MLTMGLRRSCTIVLTSSSRSRDSRAVSRPRPIASARDSQSATSSGPNAAGVVLSTSSTPRVRPPWRSGTASSLRVPGLPGT